MTKRTPHLVLLALCAALVPVAAQGQWYDARSSRPAALYPYQARPGQAYAVEVAPGAFVIYRPTSRAYHYVPPGRRYVTRQHVSRSHVVRSHRTWHRVARRASARRQFGRLPKRNDSTLIKQRRRRETKRIEIKNKKIAREKPVVIMQRRVIERHHYVEDVPLPRRRNSLSSKAERALSPAHEGTRVIHAEAEVTILGPDRITIRLYRKSGDANRVFGKQ